MSDSGKPLVVGMAKARELLDCGDDKLYHLIKTKQLDSFLDGNRRKITFASIERRVQQQLDAASGSLQRGRYPVRQPKEQQRRRHPV